jgi:hypothetical protein
MKVRVTRFARSAPRAFLQRFFLFLVEIQPKKQARRRAASTRNFLYF